MMEKIRVQIYRSKNGNIILTPFDILAFKINDGYLILRYIEMKEKELKDFEKKSIIACVLSTRTKEEILNLLSDPERNSYFYFSKEIPEIPKPLF